MRNTLLLLVVLYPTVASAIEYRPSLPDIGGVPGYTSGVTHTLKDNGIFWSVLSDRWHADKRDTEGDIVQLADGSLLAAWSDFYTPEWYDDSPSQISARRSMDGGRTWGEKFVLQPNVGGNVMSASLLRTTDNTVLLTYLAKNGPDGGTKHYVRRSLDGGLTFLNPILANVGHDNRIANNDRFLQLRDPQGTHGDAGRITLACRDYPGRDGVMVYSDDDGLTWNQGNNVPNISSQWGPQNFNEPGIVELNDGRLWMYGRTQVGFYGQSWSEDRGMTWSMPVPMELKSPYSTDPANPATSPLTGEMVPSTSYTEEMGYAGDILMTFSNWDFETYPREFDYTARNPFDSAISKDGGETWSFVRTIEEDPENQYGYTSMTFVEDDEVGMRVLLTTHVQPIGGYEHRPHDLKFMSIPLSWFYENPIDPQRGIDFANVVHAPEPSSAILLTVGMIGFMTYLWRKRR